MDGELLSLKWNNHRTTFYHIISSLRKKESYTDVTLACDGKFYPTHKFVLSTCSEYFSEIFDRTPCKNPVVVLKDIQCRDLEFLLDYMYIGEVNVRQNELSSLIKAAECLRVKGLAVPDEEPKKGASSSSVSNSAFHSSSNNRRPEQSSPPAKRRRAEDRRVAPLGFDQSPGRPPGDNPLGSPDRKDAQSSKGDGSASKDGQAESSESIFIRGDSSDAISIKEEKDDIMDDVVNVQNSYDGGDDDGDGPHDLEGNTSDFPEFLQSTVEKEEPVAISEYNPDFPGPSGLQNSGLNPWEGDNSTSFPEGLTGGAVAAAVAAATQPQQRQQQQLCHQWLEQLRRVGGLKGKAKVTCPLCGKVCSRSDKLKLHLRTHTGERPYRCNFCHHRSRTSDDLKRHIRTHTGERPYQCPYCPYRASDPSTIRSHKKHRHHDLFYHDKYLQQLDQERLKQQQQQQQQQQYQQMDSQELSGEEKKRFDLLS